MKNLKSLNELNESTGNIDKNTINFLEDLSKLMKKYKLHLFSFDDIKVRTEHAEKIAAYLDLDVVSPTTLDKYLSEL